MLGQCRRRWPNINTALDQCLVRVVSCNQFSGYINAVNMYSIGYCWPTLDRPRHAHFAVESFFKPNMKQIHKAVRAVESDMGFWWPSWILLKKLKIAEKNLQGKFPRANMHTENI